MVSGLIPMQSKKPRLLLITCEHGGCLIPPELETFLPPAKRKVLETHEGLDIGALWIAKQMSGQLNTKLIYSEISRLVVDLNRTARLSGSFLRNIKPFTEGLGSQEVLGRYYWPYRMEVEEFLNQGIKGSESVLHLSIHSFTPKLRGEVRQAEIGILYDPHRPMEKVFALALQQRLKANVPKIPGAQGGGRTAPWRIRLNYPYMGTSDGFTTYLRKVFSASQYAGVEIEFNQAWTADEKKRESLYEAFMVALTETL